MAECEHNTANQGTLLPMLYKYIQLHYWELFRRALGHFNVKGMFRLIYTWSRVNAVKIQDGLDTYLISKVSILTEKFIYFSFCIFDIFYTSEDHKHDAT